MSILTPVNAEKVNELSAAQLKLVRQSLIINDSPIQSNKTYIIFDATSGNNNLNIDIGASLSYSVLKGDGTIETLYNDTGGVKILNYAVAGIYLITIDGTFQGINTNGASQADKDKYISIICGSNYPVSLPISSFMNCTNLESFNFLLITSIAANVFSGCVKLANAYIPLVTTIGANAFDGCVELSDIVLKNVVTIGASAFNSVILSSLIIKSASEAQVVVIFNDIIAASGLFSANVKIIYGSSGGVYIVDAGNLDIIYKSTGDNSATRDIVIDFSFSDGVGYKIQGRRLVSEDYTDAFLRFLNAAGDIVFRFNADGTIIALPTYANTIGVVNRSISIDNSGNIGVSPYQEITIDIGDWNMDLTSLITIPFPSGVTISNFVKAEVWIIADSGLQVNNITDDFTTGSPSGKIEASTSPSGITISRYNGSSYDNPAYDLTPFNRGYLTITYKL